MPMSSQVYINDSLVPTEKATLSVYDHGLLYGDGVFEGIRVYDGRVFLLREHIERLYEGADAIRLEIPLSQSEMIDAVEETVKANGPEVTYVRLLVTRGSGTLGLDIRKTDNPQVIVIADRIIMYPPELYEQGLHVITAKTIRNHPDALDPRIKSLNYLNNILARIEATDAGAAEALMLNHNGEVAECTGDNVFVVREGRISTPPISAGILAGITRNTVIALAREAEYIVEETALLPTDVYSADECFLTGTAAEVVAVVRLDGREIGNGKPGPVTQKLRQRFRDMTSRSD